MFDSDPLLSRKMAELNQPAPEPRAKEKPPMTNAADIFDPSRARQGKTFASPGTSTGTVVRWLDRFGFITLDDQSANCGDVFVGVRALAAAGICSLARGDKLRFDIVPSRTKSGQFEAANITLVE